MSHRKDNAGMTIIELLTVIAIIVAIVALAVPNFSSMVRSQRWAAATASVQNVLYRCQSFAVNSRRDQAIEICTHVDNSAQYFRIETESALLESIPELNNYFRLHCEYYYMRLPQDWVRTFQNGGGEVNNPHEQPWPPEWEVQSHDTSFEYEGPRYDVDRASVDHPGSPRTQDNLKVDDHIWLPHSITVDFGASKFLTNYDKPPESANDVPQYGWDETEDLRFNVIGVLVQAQNPEIVLKDTMGEHMRLQILRSTVRVRKLAGL